MSGAVGPPPPPRTGSENHAARAQSPTLGEITDNFGISKIKIVQIANGHLLYYRFVHLPLRQRIKFLNLRNKLKQYCGSGSSQIQNFFLDTDLFVLDP